MRLSNQRYAWIDSLFALPEAVLYGCLVDYFDHNDTPGKPDYTTLWEHIRECIDLAHRDGSIKAIVSEELSSFIVRDPALAETLHKFRSSGKRLFLLTNSAWDYTSQVMSYLLDGALTAYRTAQEALTNARKHAPGQPVRVALDYAPDAVTLQVSNPLPEAVGAGPLATAGAGYGLTGLRERAAVAGGTLTAESRDGQWRVLLTLLA